MADKHTIWSKLNDREWQELRSKVDWMSAPEMHQHVARLMGGVKWIDYARDRHLQPLAERSGEPGTDGRKGIEMLSVGCGNAWVDMHCLDAGWPVRRIHCLEYDSSLLAAAKDNLTRHPIEKRFDFFDLNTSHDFDFGRFDLVFFCHSAHHCTDIEGLLSFVNRSLKPGGIVMGCDYFGPSRLQVEPAAGALIERIFEILPPHLRFNISTGTVQDAFEGPTLKSVMDYDPSEAPRSRDLRSLWFSTFPVIDLKPMGGTLLRPLLTHRAGNFRSEADHALLRLLQLFERVLIEKNVLESDDLFFVCGACTRL